MHLKVVKGLGPIDSASSTRRGPLFVHPKGPRPVGTTLFVFTPPSPFCSRKLYLVVKVNHYYFPSLLGRKSSHEPFSFIKHVKSQVKLKVEKKMTDSRDPYGHGRSGRTYTLVFCIMNGVRFVIYIKE